MATQNKKYLITIIASVFVTLLTYAQFTQTIRGRVVDQLLQKPLAGATVSIDGINKSGITQSDGSFRIKDVPVGSHQLQVSFIGFKEATLENIVVNTGKEVVLTISMETDVEMQQEVVVHAKSRKNKPLNEMSTVSARAFTVEETQKYAAAVNDPLRMATSFAGVVAADDGNNHIVIRGNSPAGLLWRMEGVDIPNPNHYATAGSSGGGISILSAQLLSNSDFVTGAFASEYGNALSGVFDLKLRKGNNERKEYTLQAGLLGLNIAAEGPIAPFYKGSYLINYRYSTLSLLSKMGLDITEGTTNFQDLSYNIYLPTRRAGDFTFFGFGGLSSQNAAVEKDSLKWDSEGDRYGGKFNANTSAAGITHSIFIGNNTQLKSAVSLSYTENNYDEQYAEKTGSLSNTYRDNYKTTKWIVSSSLNRKIGLKHALRTGIIANSIRFNYFQKSRENPNAPVLERMNTSDNTQTLQAFAQWQYKPYNKITFNAGVHYLSLLLNNTNSIEPRASLKWDIDKKNSLAIGYGLHGQIQPLGVYFAKTKSAEGEWVYPNKNLGFTKAHHFVLSYNHAFGKNLRFKTEFYYQDLFDVPVSVYDTSSFSTLNIQGDYVTEPLTNKGKGKNYGVEVSLEKYLSNNFYFLLNNSLYESKYTALDGINRNTRYNGNYVSNFTAGKDIVSKNGRRTIGANIKMIYAGGFRHSPIDLDRSRNEGYTIVDEKAAFSLQNAAYFRTDIRVSVKWNRKNLTSTLSLDIQNVSNRQNVYNRNFDPFKGEVVTSYQTGIIPILNYKIEF
ncbi:MAG: TonB-dependent receptor [Chitinophagaceae bacterium]|nr:TonB-dependent receptor [Chitinophagaceae bacterium]